MHVYPHHHHRHHYHHHHVLHHHRRRIPCHHVKSIPRCWSLNEAVGRHGLLRRFQQKEGRSMVWSGQRDGMGMAMGPIRLELTSLLISQRKWTCIEVQRDEAPFKFPSYCGVRSGQGDLTNKNVQVFNQPICSFT